MKNFSKKRGFFAAAAALLAVTAMLVTTGCSNDSGSYGYINGYADEFTLPAGKGAVKLSFNEEVARTILPGASGITSSSDFEEFDFQFTPTDSSGVTTGPALPVKTVLQANLVLPIILDPGYYDLIIIAKEEISSVMMPVASNAAAVNIHIVAAKTTTTSVTLKLIESGTGTGTFKYTITDSTDSDIVAAEMILTPFAGGAATTVDIFADSELDGAPHTLNITVGYYYVDFVIEVASGDTVTFRQIVLITQNLTSSYSFSIEADYFYGTVEGVTVNFTPPAEHAPTISYVITTEDGPDADTDDDIVTSGTYSGTTIPVTRGDKIEFTVSNAGVFTASSYEWYCVNTTSLGSTNVCSIDTALSTYTNGKEYKLTVVGILTADGKPYSTDVKFKVGS